LFNPTQGEFSKHAFFQLTDRLGIRSGARFLWDEVRQFPDDLSGLMNRFLETGAYHSNKKGPKQTLARMYDGDFRAFLSDQFVPYDNHDLLAMACEFIGDADHTIVNVPYQKGNTSRVGPDDMHVKVIVTNRKGPDSSYGLGFSLINKEIGGSAIHVNPLMQRYVCDNSVVVAMSAADAAERGIILRIPHRWHSINQINFKVKEALAFCLRESAEYMDEMYEAAAKEIPSAADVLAQMVGGNGLAINKKIVSHVVNTAVMGMEGQPTVAGIVNGLSFAAGRANGLSVEQSTELEVMAGAVLHESKGESNVGKLADSFFSLAGTPRVYVETDNA
jgi:hypothetical protein